MNTHPCPVCGQPAEGFTQHRPMLPKYSENDPRYYQQTYLQHVPGDWEYRVEPCGCPLTEEQYEKLAERLLAEKRAR